MQAIQKCNYRVTRSCSGVHYSKVVSGSPIAINNKNIFGEPHATGISTTRKISERGIDGRSTITEEQRGESE